MAGSGSKNLSAAALAKQDEFYTQLSDIEKEMRHYRKHFKNKTVCVIVTIRLRVISLSTLF